MHVHVCVDILRRFDDMVESIIPQLPTSFDDITEPDGRSALIWILGEYGEVNTCRSKNVTYCTRAYMYMYVCACAYIVYAHVTDVHTCSVVV